MKINSFLFILFILFSLPALAQNAATNSGGQVVQVQPSIMVIPMKKQGEDYRQLLENGADKRLAISRVKGAFDSRGFTTYDFEAELKKVTTLGAFNGDTQTDVKDAIVRNSGADIFVEVDIIVMRGQSGTEVTIILEAFESATGRSLSNDDESSGKYYTDDIAKLAGKAIDGMKENFLNQLQLKFTEIVTNGRSVYIEFGLSQEATINFQSEVNTDGDLLSEVIGDWMKDNAYKNYAKRGGSTALKVVYDDVRLPLKDQETGLNYEIESFGRAIRLFLRSMNIKATIDYPRGQIVVTVNQ
jgi:hypothetical protein